MGGGVEKLTREQVKQAMDRILEVRYSDFELERSLCLELLAWGEEQGDSYVTAFAHTYLGDYFIAKSDTSCCASHLTEAHDLAVEGGYDDLLTRACSLLGLYYETIADEQSSLQYYMEGMAATRRVGDAATEGLILNNIANNFQRHHGYEQALQFYQEAYELVCRSGSDNSPTACIVLSNLAAVSILLGRMEEGEAYIRQCEARGGDAEVVRTLCAQNWCQYYAAVGDAARAGEWAQKILCGAEEISANKLYAFDVYSTLFDSMMRLRAAPAAARFLELMETCCAEDSPDQKQRLESGLMSYCLAFETERGKRAAAYRRYCLRAKELARQSDKVITNGLKTAIQLYRVARQREKLNEERSELKHQVNLDELTRCYTRRYLEELIRRYERDTQMDFLGFIMVDVDCLKEYNDTYGHQKGDEVLRAVGASLRTHATEHIYPCRFGGDEFVCFCANLTDEEMLNYIGAVREELQRRNIPHEASRCAQRVTLSIGCANEPRASGASVHSLLEWADKALYRAKIDGRNTYSKHGA